jgi:transcriptional regulator with XRE-family HTH domain
VGATPFGRQFGANLAHHRRRAGLTQEDLADLAALHRTAVGQLERGERIPRADTFLKLATSLCIDSSRLLDGIVWTPPRLDTGSFGFEEVHGPSDSAPPGIRTAVRAEVRPGVRTEVRT